MAKLLLGKPVADEIHDDLQARTEQLRNRAVVPTLALIRVGADPSDLSYEKSIVSRAETVGVAIRKYELPATAKKEEVLDVIDRVNRDGQIHGALLFRPLPAHLKACAPEICNRLNPQKDVDGMTDLSASGVFTGTDVGFAPCTPAACMEILRHYGIPCRGKNVAVVGRSMVVGRPLSMLLLRRDATVTVCHTGTVDTAKICRNADMIVTSAGVLNFLTADFVRPGQVVIDVSVNYDENKPNARGGLGSISGDADFAQVAPIVDAITPVPGGVGVVTASVLMKHVVEAAERTEA